MKGKPISACLAIAALILLSGTLAAAVASEIPFNVTGASFDPGSGYGIDASESAGAADLLDVRFDTEGFLAQSFLLNAIGDSHTFNIGTVSLKERNEHQGIQPEETDGLGVAASLSFLNPMESTQRITAMGTATAGSVSDRHLDYMLRWDPILVNFGEGGLFGISLATLNFDNKQFPTQTQTATITVFALPEDMQVLSAGIPIHAPEPATLLLLGAGLGVLGLAKRRVGKH